MVFINFFSDIEVTDVTVDVATSLAAVAAVAPYHHNTVTLSNNRLINSCFCLKLILRTVPVSC